MKRGLVRRMGSSPARADRGWALKVDQATLPTRPTKIRAIVAGSTTRRVRIRRERRRQRSKSARRCSAGAVERGAWAAVMGAYLSMREDIHILPAADVQQGAVGEEVETGAGQL